MHGPPPGAHRALRAFRPRVRVRVMRARVCVPRGHVYVHTCPRAWGTRGRPRGRPLAHVCVRTQRAARLRLRDATLRIYQYYFLQLIYYAASRHAAARGVLDRRGAARSLNPPVHSSSARKEIERRTRPDFPAEPDAVLRYIVIYR